MSVSRVEGDLVLHPRSVLVTGANRGLGLEIVKQLLKLPQPPEVIISTCRSLSASDHLRELANANPRVEILELDVARVEQVPAFVERVANIVGDAGLNLLINNAGIAHYRPNGGLEETPVDGFIQHLNVHVTGPFALVKGLLPLLKLAAGQHRQHALDVNHAAVVNISSNLGSIANAKPGDTIPFPFYAYRSAKAAMIMMSRLMGLDLAQYGILALAVHPGWARTGTGGPDAPLCAEESIAKVLHVLANVKPEHSGLHVGLDGAIEPW